MEELDAVVLMETLGSSAEIVFLRPLFDCPDDEYLMISVSDGSFSWSSIPGDDDVGAEGTEIWEEEAELFADLPRPLVPWESIS